MKTLKECKHDFMAARRECLLAMGANGVKALAALLESRIEQMRLELETAGAEAIANKQGRIAELRCLLANLTEGPPKPGM